MIRLVAFSLLFIAFHGFGQVKKAEKYVRDLASPEFHGRGYVNGGDSLAANYISRKFEEFGLKSFRDNFYQPFSMEVNTFPGAMDVRFKHFEEQQPKDSLSGTKSRMKESVLVPGVDYIVDPHSASAKGTYPVVVLDSAQLFKGEWISNYREQFGNLVVIMDVRDVVLRDTKMELASIKYELTSIFDVIYWANEKLTWSVGNSQLNHALVEVNTEKDLSKSTLISLNIEARLKSEHPTQNVIGYVPATKKKGRKHYRVFTAHYDHLGRMGIETYIPGANDNASGTSMLLLLAEHYAKNPSPDYNVAFIAFAGEEAGLIGSKHYVDNPLFPLDRIDFLLNMDLLGTGEEGIAVVNATLHEGAFQKLLEFNKEQDYFVKIRKRGEAANSDHYFFTKAGVPAFFIYTMGGISAYHDVNDKAETLPMTEFKDLLNFFICFMDTVK